MFARRQGLRVRELLKTPHDSLMLIYFLWVVFTSGAIISTLGSIHNVFLFYLVTVLALSSLRRIQIYLVCWTGLILIIAAFAIASEYGFDPMGSYDLTHGRMKGRLSLNLSIFENPNVLGHSVAPALLLLFFLLVWKRPIFARVAVLPLFALPVFCIFLTASKGAFLACFAMALAGFCFGRPKLVQLWLLAGALTIGWAAVSQLPRMQELSQGSQEAGIAGRVIAFRYGHDAMRGNLTGVGYDNFLKEVTRVYNYSVTPHSSYVNVGAQTGFPGLLLFCGILYCCFRTLLFMKTNSIEEERVRRLLFVLLISYEFSSWMIDWAFRAYFFLIVAAIAGFHRHLLTREAVPVQSPQPPAAFEADIDTANRPEKTEKPSRPLWNRLRWIDLGLIFAATWATVFFWKFAMRHV